MLTITDSEYILLQRFLEEHCGLQLEEGKKRMVESRLTDLALENDCDSIRQFYEKISAETGGKLRERIIDVMTRDETFWFRDRGVWRYLGESEIPRLLEKAENGANPRIWSAAVSTGQEAYSMAIFLQEVAESRNQSHLLQEIEIWATDISVSSLFLAISGRYDRTAINRGLPENLREKYFKPESWNWILDENLRKRVKFQRFNLHNSFDSLGKFDLILCRYSAMFYTKNFRRRLFHKFADALNQAGVLLLGISESSEGLSDRFEVLEYKDCIINRLRKQN